MFSSRRASSSPRHPALIALLLLCTMTVSNLVLAQSHADPRWVSTWATSPSTLFDSGEDVPELNNQTIRLIAHTSAGGSSLRLRLANYHGEKALKVGAVAVALQTEADAINPDSSKPVTFGGKADITIARGAVVISDPIAFEVPALANLAVSIYVPEPSGFVTAHRLSNQANYISGTGNQVTATTLTDVTESAAWSLLTAIDVISTESPGTIAVVGDSITDGWGSTASANQRWPNHFARRLFADDSIPDYAIANAGISGNQVTTEGIATFGENLQARFERDVLALSKVTHMVLMEGINDIGMSSRSGTLISAEAIISGYRQIIARAQARGIKVIGATLTPYEGAAYYTPEGEQVRQTVNAYIRSGGEFDGVIDFEKAVQDPANPIHILPGFTADNLHPNDDGYKAMADVINLDLFR